MTWGQGRGWLRKPRTTPADDRGPSEPTKDRFGDPVKWFVVIAVLLVGFAAFWLAATPHQQCYLSDGTPAAVEYPIQRIDGAAFVGLPQQFRSGGELSADAVLDCRWELGQPHRVTSGS